MAGSQASGLQGCELSISCVDGSAFSYQHGRRGQALTPPQGLALPAIRACVRCPGERDGGWHPGPPTKCQRETRTKHTEKTHSLTPCSAHMCSCPSAHGETSVYILWEELDGGYKEPTLHPGAVNRRRSESRVRPVGSVGSVLAGEVPSSGSPAEKRHSGEDVKEAGGQYVSIWRRTSQLREHSRSGPWSASAVFKEHTGSVWSEWFMGKGEVRGDSEEKKAAPGSLGMGPAEAFSSYS